RTGSFAEICSIQCSLENADGANKIIKGENANIYMSRPSAGGASAGPPPLRAEESLDKALGVPPLEASDCGGIPGGLEAGGRRSISTNPSHVSDSSTPGRATGLPVVDDLAAAAAAADAPGSAEEEEEGDAAALVRKLAGLAILDAWMRHKIVLQFTRLKESLYKAVECGEERGLGKDGVGVVEREPSAGKQPGGGWAGSRGRPRSTTRFSPAA
ncbi:MAG: hypothetical protein BJ554DRAFT_4850, partial [Olpidium bornovanus]